MISKEVFCTALRLRDKQFDKDCEVIAFFDEQYEAKSRLFLEAPEYLYNALYSLLAEAFGVASAVFNDSIGLENYEEDEVFRFEIKREDGTLETLYTYEAFYDYLLERRA